jgi:hypothetical protein
MSLQNDISSLSKLFISAVKFVFPHECLILTCGTAPFPSKYLVNYIEKITKSVNYAVTIIPP